jgi:hypothetical protein
LKLQCKPETATFSIYNLKWVWWIKTKRWPQINWCRVSPVLVGILWVIKIKTPLWRQVLEWLLWIKLSQVVMLLRKVLALSVHQVPQEERNLSMTYLKRNWINPWMLLRKWKSIIDRWAFSLLIMERSFIRREWSLGKERRSTYRTCVICKENKKCKRLHSHLN